MTRTHWGFYGRQGELKLLGDILRRGRWFFLKLAGRRRIGKSRLVREACRAAGVDPVYLQVPDSDPAGVVAAARDFLATFAVAAPPPTDLRSLARTIAALVRAGRVVIIDEFQYFARQILFEFNSHLQYEVDRLAEAAGRVHGGLIVLGSLHTEMAALLEDRSAPLFNRVTDQLDVPHLDIGAVVEILRTHADAAPERLLFLWNLFEGVPKFYRDCHELDALGLDRQTLVGRMFMQSSAPLRAEAESWFARELRGRYDLVLKFIAANPGCTLGQLAAHARAVADENDRHLGGYLQVLRDRYAMIERLQPVFARPTARNGRYYLRDNFLRSWLAALAVPVASLAFRSPELLIEDADRRLVATEGYGFERLVATLYEERSRRGRGDFALTERIHGYWDRQGTELDLVALSEDNRVVRLGTCKRNADRLITDLPTFDGHVSRFVGAMRRLEGWRVERVALTPRHTPESRRAATARGYLPQDLGDLTAGL